MGSDGSPEWVSNGHAVRVVRHDPGSPVDITRWPATVPAVEQLLCEGLELPSGLTVLVGENGSGKSTVMEMLAEAYGLSPILTAWDIHGTRPSRRSSPLASPQVTDQGPIARK